MSSQLAARIEQQDVATVALEKQMLLAHEKLALFGLGAERELVPHTFLCFKAVPAVQELRGPACPCAQGASRAQGMVLMMSLQYEL